jgi:uncharacterized membrane protein YdjX (TVP38/TMEM64 family)/rhodanese-related sulfurtransferase
MTARLLGRLALGGALAVLVGLAVTYRGALDAERLQSALATLGGWAPAAFVALFAAATVAFLPGAVFALVGGALFGPWLGTALNLFGSTVGAVAAFLAARYLVAEWARRKSGPRLARLIEGVEAEGWRFVAFVRLVPLFPFNLVNYAFGLTRIGTGAYAAATFVCMAPGAFAYTWLGHAGREALAGGEGMVRDGLLALGLLAAVAFLPRLVGRWRRGKGTIGGPERIDVGELRRRLEADDDLLLLDVRDAADFTGELGHAPRAVNLPLPELAGRLAEIEAWRDRPLAVVCRTDKRSAKAAEALRQAGFARVALVEGGMAEWQRRGYPTGGEV